MIQCQAAGNGQPTDQPGTLRFVRNGKYFRDDDVGAEQRRSPVTWMPTTLTGGLIAEKWLCENCWRPS